MGETLPLFKASFNHAVQVESRPEHLTGEAGALIQREIMDRLGIIEWLGERLTDPRDPSRVTYPLADLIRTHLMLLGQGWRDQDDADRLRLDPALRVARSEEHTSELQSRGHLVCRLLLEQKKLQNQVVLASSPARLEVPVHMRIRVCPRNLRAHQDSKWCKSTRKLVSRRTDL